MTVAELIEALQALPKEAQYKPVVVVYAAGYQHPGEFDVDVVDYDLRVVTLR